MIRSLFLIGAGLAAAACSSTRGAQARAPQTVEAASPRQVVAPRPGLPAQQVAAAPSSRRATIQRILSSNVRLFVHDGGEVKKSASGVVVGSELSSRGSATYILTNAHVLDARGMTAPELRVVVDRPWEGAGAEPMEFLAAPVAVGSLPDMDLALVKIIGIQLDAVELAGADELIPGDEVVVAAAPFGRALSISGGLVSHVQWNKKGQATLLKTDAPIGYGASGGGIFSLETGRLLALVEGYRTAKIGFAVQKEQFSFDVPMPGETFAAPATKVRHFLETRGFARLLESGDDAGATRTAGR